MKWAARDAPEPVDGDSRVRVRFAWLPVRTVDHYWVWLEHIIATEVYSERVYIGDRVYGPQWETTCVESTP